MRKYSREEIEDIVTVPNSIQREYPYATVVPLSRGIRWNQKMHTVNRMSGEFLRSEARYKLNVERAQNECRPYVEESRKIIRHISSLEQNNLRTINELKKMRSSSVSNLDKKTLRDMFTLELLQNNEMIMRHKDRLNELKRIQKLIYSMHEAPLRDREVIRDAKLVHHIKPYVRYLGTRVTRGGRMGRLGLRTVKVTRRHLK